ncbi:hypothetical protein D3C75_904300 [compost metagenome]
MLGNFLRIIYKLRSQPAFLALAAARRARARERECADPAVGINLGDGLRTESGRLQAVQIQQIRSRRIVGPPARDIARDHVKLAVKRNFPGHNYLLIAALPDILHSLPHFAEVGFSAAK